MFSYYTIANQIWQNFADLKKTIFDLRFQKFATLQSAYELRSAKLFCWVTVTVSGGTHGKTLFFNLPVMLQITSNIVFFGLTIRNCSKIKSELQQMQNNSNAKLKYHADINK